MKMSPATLVALALAPMAYAGPLIDRALEPPTEPKANERHARADAEGPVAREATIRLRGAAWFSALDGHVRSGQTFPGITSEVDFIDTLDLSKNKLALEANIGLNLGAEGRWKIDAGFTGPFKYTGTSGAVSFSFKDIIYTGNADSRVRFNIYQINITRDWVRAGPVTFTFGTGSRIFDFDATITGTGSTSVGGPVTTQTKSVSQVVPIPGLFAGLRFDLTNHLYVSGSAQGLYVGSYGQFFDAKGEVGYDFTRNVGIFAGYRWINAKANVSDVRFRTDLAGFFTGLEVRF